MKELIDVIVVGYDGEPSVISIENELSAFQKIVGGNIEAVPWLFDDSPAVFVNEEGKLTQMPNRAVYARASEAEEGLLDINTMKPVEEGALLDILFGTILCVGHDEETGESRSVTEDEIERVRERFPIDTAGSGTKEVARIMSGERRRS